MIEEKGRIVAKEGGQVWVETVRHTACASCSARKGCGHSVLEKWMSKKANHLLVKDNLNLEVGDQVVIGVPEDVVLKGTLVVYLLPMVTLIFGAVLGNELAGPWNLNQDLAAGVGSLLGFLVGMYGVRRHSAAVSHDAHYQPVILRRDSSIAFQAAQFECKED